MKEKCSKLILCKLYPSRGSLENVQLFLDLTYKLGPGDNLGFRLIVEKTIKFFGKKKRLKLLWSGC